MSSILLPIEQGYNGLGLKDYESAGVQNPSTVKARIIANARARITGRGLGKEEQSKRPPGASVNRSNSGGFPVEGFTRNARSVWTITTNAYPDAHFATFPEELPTRCIKAGSRISDTVLDPFTGSGTTGEIALKLGRSFVGCELNPKYEPLWRARIGGAAPLFTSEAAS